LLVSFRGVIRDATRSDGARCAAIYAPYVEETAISFETEPPSADQMSDRIEAAHAWVVLEHEAEIVGYAYAGPFRARQAYRFTCEVSVYLEMGRRRTGAGRALYEALFERLAAAGFKMAVAGLTVPNEASVGLHRALGFEEVGTFRHVGFKLDAWRDVTWMERPVSGALD
jgi:L-amino acid N-acyltransferase YncA